jgi:ankyrin repeat domain-containing protein 50
MTHLSSTIIQDIEAMCEAGNASMAYFYFDFRDANKQCLHGLITSLLARLSVRSDSRYRILWKLYVAHDNGLEQPSDNTLAKCLKEMLTTPDRRATYLIIDGLDESPNASGFPSHREGVLELLKELVGLPISNLRVCVTSRPEIDIRHAVEPLARHQVSLHDESGQKKDIADYIRSVVYSSSEQFMRRWKTEDKEHVIKTLSERASSDV